LNTAFGSTLLLPDSEEGRFTFTLPKPFAEKSGVCTWQLVQDGQRYASGKITILPHPKKNAQIESYLGPRSITAGGNDFSMLVTAPTDIYDNPLPDSTVVDVKKQFESKIEEVRTPLKNGIGWKNLYSSTTSGRLLIAASAGEATSKELTTMVHPAQATDFMIKYTRNHKFADGNQVIVFATDVIKDKFQNVVSDGTLVTFLVTDAKGMRLQTTGTTTNGLAKGKLLHPDVPTRWTVTGYITGAAKSNTIAVDFEAALDDFQVSYSDDGRTLNIARMQSFMGQLVPDGIPVSLEIRNKEGKLLKTLRTSSRLGHAQFKIPEDFYPNGDYGLKVKAAGIVKHRNVLLQ
jgi:hypothetical protein